MLIIGNGKLVTRDDANPFIENGAVVVDGKIIKEVGTTEALKAKYPDAEFKDARGRLIMPGLINTHMHYYSTFARGMALDAPPATMFSQILNNLWWALDKKLDLQDSYISAMGPMMDQIRNGVTTSIDHHASPYHVRGSLQKIHEAATEVGIRSNLCYELSDRDGEKIADEGIAENIEFIKYCNDKKDDMIKGLFGIHASMTVSDKTLDKALTQMEGLNSGFHVHCAEGIEDVADSLAKYKKRVIERWYDAGVLGKKSLAVHCVHLSEAEKEILVEANVPVINNPESNMGNAVGRAPIVDLMARGALVGMGTDGYTTDMLESYKVEGIIMKHDHQLPSVGWGEPPTMLFKNNREIVGRHIDGEVGILKEGAYADIIVVDYQAPTPLDGSNIDGHLLFGVCGKNVDCTMVNGKMIMDERILVNLDEEKIMAESRALAQKCWDSFK